MTMAFGIEGRVPFLDRHFIELAFQIPAALKFQAKDGIEKRLLRKSFSDTLPAEIVWRTKQKFSAGTGSAHLMADYARSHISDRAFKSARKSFPEAGLRSKEELLYYRIFRDQMGKNLPSQIIGRTRSVTAQELS